MSSKQGGLYWLNPLFLLARIFEFREEGYDNRSAVVLGTTVTGPIISTVGLINQFGFLVTVGVVIDTFLIRNLLAPSIFVFLGDMNYWPYRMPKADKDVLTSSAA